MKILVTGASGFIGREVVLALQRRGHQVIAASLRGADGKYSVVSIQSSAVFEQPFDCIIHAAWGGNIAAERNDLAIQQRNVECFQALLAAVAANPPKIFIAFGSQAELYQSGTPYAVAKLECLRLLQALALHNGMRALWLRLFSVYGPLQGPEWLIPSLIVKLLRHEPIDLTPGEQEMDWLHVEDVANAVLCAMDSSAEGVYEVGQGHSTSLRRTVELLDGITDSNSKLNFGALPYRSGQVMRAGAYPARFANDCGWSPQQDFYAGLKEVVRHFKAHLVTRKD